MSFVINMEQMSILLNGEKRSFKRGITVQELLEQFEVPSGTVVVEVNEGILPKESHATVKLEEGDRVELVRFVGGGGILF